MKLERSTQEQMNILEVMVDRIWRLGWIPIAVLGWVSMIILLSAMW